MPGIDSRIWDLALKLMVPAVIALTGAVIAHEVRISKIEETRFTNGDGHILYERLTNEVSIKLDVLVKSQTEMALKLERIAVQLEKK